MRLPLSYCDLPHVFFHKMTPKRWAAPHIQCLNKSLAGDLGFNEFIECEKTLTDHLLGYAHQSHCPFPTRQRMTFAHPLEFHTRGVVVERGNVQVRKVETVGDFEHTGRMTVRHRHHTLPSKLIRGVGTQPLNGVNLQP